MPRLRLCQGCGEMYAGTGARCAECGPGPAADRDRARRAAKPQRAVWDSAEWKRTRRLVIERDEVCVLCGSVERLTADHYPQTCAELLEAGIDPCDPDLCRALCGRCSGREDGRRSAPRGVGVEKSLPARQHHPAGSSPVTETSAPWRGGAAA